MGTSGSLGQQTTSRPTSRGPARQNSLVPAGPSELGVGLKGHFCPSVNYCETVVVWHSSSKAGTDGLVPLELVGGPPTPPTAPVLLVGEALVPDGWEDSVGIEL